MIRLERIVVVPRLARAVPELYEANASLDQSPGNGQLACMCSRSVSLADFERLAGDVERVRRLRLHAVGQLERLNARFQRGVGRSSLAVPLVELVQHIELFPLLR